MNENIKEFIEEIVSSVTVKRNFLELMMDRANEFSERIGKRIVDFSKHDVHMFYNQLDMRASTKYVYHTILRQYCAYCGNEITSWHTVLQSEIEETEKDFVYITREQLDKFQENMRNAADKFYSEALFCGMGGVQLAEITSISMEDVDAEQKIVKLENRDFLLTDRLYEFLCKAINEYAYYDTERNIVKELVDVDYPPTVYKVLPRGVRPGKPSVQSRQRMVQYSIHNSFASAKLTVKDLVLSGFVNEVKTEMKKLDMEFGEFVKTPLFLEIGTKFGFKAKNDNYLRRNLRKRIEKFI